MSTDRGMDKNDVVFTHSHTHTHTHTHTHVCMHGLEYYSAVKKNEIMPFAATQMHLEITTLSEIIQKEED